MKRITLRAVYKTAEGDFQPGASVEVADLKADQLVKAGKAVVSELQTIYTHEEDMPSAMREKALKALQAADLVGGPNEQPARAAATAPFRK